MCISSCFNIFSEILSDRVFRETLQEERGDRGEGSRWKTERGADRSRLGRSKNVSQFSWRNLNCPGGPCLSAQGGY